MHTRSTDPETSHEAEASTVPLSRVKHYILDVFSHLDADDEVLVSYVQMSVRVTPQRIRTARSELVREGRVIWVGDYARSSTGRRARVWGLTR